ncbi:LysE family transporter [Thalassotalea sp. M1531]|uniref:LysE family transporter n=1 Tax=Thalassotalea algicola TaxID=2716224 RepID=A0A7Y0LD60_9GAMM|nr:LysE family transporter [Thalassotalea algicola]NMP32400.1 LysE family transporter [Thalassotalea algicola]
MEFIQGLIVITSIHLLAAASPGPDFVLVSQQTLANGKRAGLLCSLGIALGLSVHIIYSSLGLAAIIANSETALWVIRILGGCYLLYLGVNGLQANRKDSVNIDLGTENKFGTYKTITTGFLCNVFNPKAPIYFVALFTMVLSPEMPMWQLAFYGVWLMVLQMLWFSLVVFMLSNSVLNSRFQRSAHWIDRILGGAMILMGIKVLTTKV